MIRNPLAFIPYILALAAVIAGLLWNASEHVPGLGRNVETGTALIGGPFALIDQDGIKRTDASYHGQYMLVYFGYSFCPDVCPTTLAKMGDALGKMGAKAARIAPIFVTVDPERDTPKVLKDYLAAFGPRFIGLTGDTAAITAAEKAYRVYAAKHPLPSADGKDAGYAMDHSSVIYLMGPDGRFIAYYDDGLAPEALAADLNKRI